jgi:serine O-acetyltransferase
VVLPGVGHPGRVPGTRLLTASPDSSSTVDEFVGPNGWRRAIAAKQPGFVEAVVADTRVTAANRGERFTFRNRLDVLTQAIRLAVVTDSFLAQALYRLKVSCQVRGVPIAPRLLHRLAIMTGQISIGDPVVVAPGVYFPHGQVVIDGLVEIDRGTTIAPFVTIGLVAGVLQGPTIGRHVSIGTGAKIVGPVTIGANASVGANAVVLEDVPAGATAVGVPARVIPRRPRS